MRYSSDWRVRHNDRISNFFYPDYQYSNDNYPCIVPYCALPNLGCIMQYEIEDLIDKKYRYELYKLMLKKDGYYTDLKYTNPTILTKDKNMRKVEFASKIINDRINTERDNNTMIERIKKNEALIDKDLDNYLQNRSSTNSSVKIENKQSKVLSNQNININNNPEITANSIKTKLKLPPIKRSTPYQISAKDCNEGAQTKKTAPTTCVAG